MIFRAKRVMKRTLRSSPSEPSCALRLGHNEANTAGRAGALPLGLQMAEMIVAGEAISFI
jgi:hypothetical protein